DGLLGSCAADWRQQSSEREIPNPKHQPRSKGSPLSRRQHAHPLSAGNEAVAIAGDPEVNFLAQVWDAVDIEKRRNGPKERKAPGEPAEGAESVVDVFGIGRH